MHRFKNEHNFTREPLEKQRHFLKIDLVVSFKKPDLIFCYLATKRLLRIYRAICEKKWQIPEVFTHSKLVRNLFHSYVIKGVKSVPKAAKVLSEIIFESAIETMVQKHDLGFFYYRLDEA